MASFKKGPEAINSGVSTGINVVKSGDKAVLNVTKLLQLHNLEVLVFLYMYGVYSGKTQDQVGTGQGSLQLGSVH